MVMIERRLDPQDFLQQPVRCRRGKKIAAPHDMRNALIGIVDDHRQVIRRRHVPSGDDEITPRRRVRLDHARVAVAFFMPPQAPDAGNCLFCVQTERVTGSRGDAGRGLERPE